MNVIEMMRSTGGRPRRGVPRAVQMAGAAMALAGAAVLGPVPVAAAQPCPDVEVIFARGTNEPPGVGPTGQAFVDALRWQLGLRPVGVYAVNYAASGDFYHPDFPRTVADGMRDAATRVQFMSTACPNTRLVLGGFSQGAVVSGFVTADGAPPGSALAQLPVPLAPDVADNVAAVVLFGKPAGTFLQKYGQSGVSVNSLLAPKTIEFCAPGDPVCGAGNDDAAHGQYAGNGMVQQGAGFAVGRMWV